MDKANTSNHNEKAHLTQIEHVYTLIPVTSIGPITGALLTGIMFRDYIDHERIYTWLALIIFSFAPFIFIWFGFKKNGVSTTNAKKMSTQYIYSAWLAVICWGSVSFFLFSENNLLPQLLLTLFVIIGAVMIMASTFFYSPVIYTVFAMTLPLIAQFIRIGNETHYLLALGLIVITTMILFLHSHINAALEKSLTLQFKNIQLAEDLKIQKDKAEKASMDKSKFMAAASHDLRQPLHAHGLFLGELKERCNKNSIYDNVISKLELSLDSISNLFNSLLDISKLEAGTITPNIKPFRFNTFIQPIAQEFEAKAQHKGLKFKVAKSTIGISSDNILLERIIRNILENSIRYTTNGTILLGCRRKKSTATIQILDTGQGIPEVDKESIFNEYHQLEQHQRIKKQGMGLGLAVVKQLCNLLGHNISVTSKVNKGSVFSIEVPIAHHKISEDTPHLTHIADNLKGLKIIVIDDEEIIRDSMTGILSAWGCRVIAASDADEAEAQIKIQFIPDVIISDFQLENKKTGIDAINQLRIVTGTDTHAALITGDTSPMDMKELQLKQYPLLHKPVNPAKLRTLLNYMVRK